MTIAKPPPPFSRAPNGLAGPKVFLDILTALPLRDLAVIDFPSRAERYVYLTLDYVKEVHIRKYRPREIEKLLSDLKNKGSELLNALKCTGGPVIEAYNATRDKGDPTFGGMERVTETFLHALERVQTPDDSERGRKRAESVRVIVRQAAEDFKDITGNAPSRSTNREGFIDFVKKLFEVSGVRENPDHFVRDLLEE